MLGNEKRKLAFDLVSYVCLLLPSDFIWFLWKIVMCVVFVPVLVLRFCGNLAEIGSTPANSVSNIRGVKYWENQVQGF